MAATSFFVNKYVASYIISKLATDTYIFEITLPRLNVSGFPNVGKSSLINSLKRSRACNVGATPGVTKYVNSFC